MLCIPLSYAREDAARAKIVAVALDKAGHKVWWDQTIRAGAQYGKEYRAGAEGIGPLLSFSGPRARRTVPGCVTKQPRVATMGG